MVAHLTGGQGVAGSNPVTPTEVSAGQRLGGHENRGRAMNVHPEDRCFTLWTEPREVCRRVMTGRRARLHGCRAMRGTSHVVGTRHPLWNSSGRSCAHEAVHRMHPELRGVEPPDRSTGTVQRVWPGVRRARHAHPGRERDVPHPRADPRELPAQQRRHRGACARSLLAGGRDRLCWDSKTDVVTARGSMTTWVLGRRGDR